MSSNKCLAVKWAPLYKEGILSRTYLDVHYNKIIHTTLHVCTSLKNNSSCSYEVWHGSQFENEKLKIANTLQNKGVGSKSFQSKIYFLG